ncbi:MAG TPA: class II fructose-bisphosphate aldolase [Patescibacteria group bacterium]|nr:class II fructose-bisphosphate aldolase [Patescibacteria group bacterium]
MNVQEILNLAKSGGYALGSFNAGDLEIIKGVIQAGVELKSPLLIEASPGEIKFFGHQNFDCVVENFKKETGLPILTNLDHSLGLEEAQEGIESGFDLIHFDGSDLAYEENIKITKMIVQQAHEKGILVEGEFDKILGTSAPHQEEPESVQASGSYTDPEKAAEFVSQTGVDILAVFIGNLHGTYKQPPKLDLERLRMIAEKLPCFLSLHGGSGLLEEDIKQAINLGKVVKINVNTELRVAYRETLENVLKGSEEVAIYKIMPPVIAAVQKVVEEKIRLFGSEGKATTPTTEDQTNQL